MEHFYQNIHGWFSFPNLYQNAVKKYNNAVFVEVGTWLGRSAAFLAVEVINAKKNIQIHCVDTWEGGPEHQDMDVVKKGELYEQFLKNIEPVKEYIKPIRMDSAKAAELYEDNSVDFVFIDAGHEYESVKKDMEVWYPKVKNGGIFAGHDYYLYLDNNLKKAVDDFFTARDIQSYYAGEDCWGYKKVS
jgi:predicted O-methyltransferase YrrM